MPFPSLAISRFPHGQIHHVSPPFHAGAVRHHLFPPAPASGLDKFHIRIHELDHGRYAHEPVRDLVDVPRRVAAVVHEQREIALVEAEADLLGFAEIGKRIAELIQGRAGTNPDAITFSPHPQDGIQPRRTARLFERDDSVA